MKEQYNRIGEMKHDDPKRKKLMDGLKDIKYVDDHSIELIYDTYKIEIYTDNDHCAGQVDSWMIFEKLDYLFCEEKHYLMKLYPVLPEQYINELLANEVYSFEYIKQFLKEDKEAGRF